MFRETFKPSHRVIVSTIIIKDFRVIFDHELNMNLENIKNQHDTGNY